MSRMIVSFFCDRSGDFQIILSAPHYLDPGPTKGGRSPFSVGVLLSLKLLIQTL